MAEYKTKDEVPQDLLDKAKNLKKTEKKAKKLITALDDSDVESVSGGYRKRTGFAAGYKIECPICGRNTREGIESWENDYYECSVFYCDNCEFSWGIDEYGDIWEDFF